MKPNDVFDELQNCPEDVPIFRKLISITLKHKDFSARVKEWHTVLAHIMEIISNNSELGNERVLLACHAFYALFSALYESDCYPQFFTNTIEHFQKLESHDLCFLEKRYVVSDLELFKLLNAYGYLQTNQKDMTANIYTARYFYSVNALLTMFDVIYRNCIKYTRYSYFAYKVLLVWLKRFEEIPEMRFRNIDTLERKLEVVIFSNWSNALNDVAKQNAQIFNIYLRIMSRKYGERFIHLIYSTCCGMSWQNETKYIILTEVCQVWNMGVTNESYLYSLCNALQRNSLRCGSTKVYLTILRKLKEDEWKTSFEKVMKFFINCWESGEHEDHNALQSLFKCWLEPTIKMYEGVLPFLWELCDDLQGYFFRSHLQRMAAELRINLPQADEIDRYITNKEEIVRLNAFAVVCHRVLDLHDANKADPFSLIKQFLWFNANAATIVMREGIIKYFRILCSNILKSISTRVDCPQSIYEFVEWLHEYFLDCFEMGSSYQRKILALNLYRILLSFTNEHSHKNCGHHGECLRHITAIDKHLRTTGSWKFTNKESLFVLLRLVLDSALDIRQLAAGLILEYFGKDILSITEKQILYNCAWEHCNSSKFYKIESGAALMKIMAHWAPLNELVRTDATAIFSDTEHNNILSYTSYSEFLLNEAEYQLALMKDDLLKAIVQNKPFYGVLTALLTVAFHAGPEDWILTSLYTERVLNLLKDAVNFFLSKLSTKASNTVYSSSFAEMGLAIDETIKISEIDDSNYDELQLSPAHQVLISCIWMSLKVSCEIVSKIGMLMRSDTQVKCSMDIIVTVLMKCRHKGVVESAGVAIANLSRCLYNRKEYSELPKAYLTRLLEEDTKKSLHLTRRGAGLSIMFHRLVVSDNRRDRPMMHLAVQMLLRSLEDFSMVAVRSVEVGQDSPWAKRLHFLRALVADKEIHSQLIVYIEDICLTCFKYMESDIWTVRNASLQLYGAVVPRLVGQCSGRCDNELDLGDGYSVNHFVTHFPNLANHMWTQLWNVSQTRGTSSTALRSYSGIVHILILLSKLSIDSMEFVNYPARTFITEIKHLLHAFLGNPMIYVRQLAAKAYTALTPFSSIISEKITIWQEVLSSRDINMSHGCLLVHNYLLEIEKYYIKNTMYNINFDSYNFDLGGSFRGLQYCNIIKAWCNMLEQKSAVQPAYVLENLFLHVSRSELRRVDRVFFECNLPIIESIISSQNIQPGFFQFVGHWSRLYTGYFKYKIRLDEYDQEAVSEVLNSKCTEQAIEFLNGLSYCVPMLEFILRYLMSIKGNRHQLFLDEIVTFTVNTIKHASLEAGNGKLEFDKIAEEFNEIETTVTNSYMIPVKNSLTLAFSKCETLISKVLSYVFDICMDEKQSMRLTAAKYIELALPRFAQLENRNKLMALRCCLILLKDEVAEICEIVSTSLQRYALREDAVDFMPGRLQHDEIVYQRLLKDVVNLQFDIATADESVDFIRYFTCAIKDNNTDAMIENPFNHDDNIFYRGESKFLNLYFLYDPSSGDRDTRHDCSEVTRAIQTRHFRKLQERAGFSYVDLQVILYLKEMDYLARKRDVIVQQPN